MVNQIICQLSYLLGSAVPVQKANKVIGYRGVIPTYVAVSWLFSCDTNLQPQLPPP